MPLVVLLAYGLTLLSGRTDTTVPGTPLVSLPVLLLVYGVSAYCEQLGWTAILTDALLTRFGVLTAGLIAGLIWALWHLVPFVQTHHSAVWVMWQCLYTIIYRVLLTRVYLVTNHSVFATIALHATYNTAFTLLPSFGSSYDPMWMAVATLLATTLVFAGTAGNQWRRLGLT